LLFNPQEILTQSWFQIENYVKESGFEFVGALYPDSQAPFLDKESFKALDEFEQVRNRLSFQLNNHLQRDPMAFKNMYRFLCRKPKA